MSIADFSVSLHVGVHRTGTTHLQRVLGRNRGKVEGGGNVLWLPEQLRGEGNEIPHRLGFPKPGRDAPAPDEGQSVPQIEALISQGAKRLVISEENYVGPYRNKRDELFVPLYPNAVRNLTALARALDPVPLDLFVGVRESCGFLRGLYSQVLLSGAKIPPAVFFFDHGPESINWVEYIGRLRAVPGIRNITVWPYEDYPDNLDAVIQQMVLLPEGESLNQLDKRVHPSLSALAVRQILKGVADVSGRAERAKRAAKIRNDLLIEGGHGAFDPFPPEQRAEAVEQYELQMAEIRQMPGVTVLQGQG